MVGFRPEYLQHDVGRRRAVHQDFRFDFMKRLIAEDRAGVDPNRSADPKTLLMERGILDAYQPSLAIKRFALALALLIPHQDSGRLGTDFNGHEAADVSRLLQWPAVCGRRFGNGLPTIYGNESIDQSHSVAVGDQLIEIECRRRH